MRKLSVKAQFVAQSQAAHAGLNGLKYGSRVWALEIADTLLENKDGALEKVPLGNRMARICSLSLAFLFALFTTVAIASKVVRIAGVSKHILRSLPVAITLVAGLFHGSACAVTYGYDAYGRLQTATNSSGQTAHYVYDTRGNLIRIEQTTSNQLAITSFSPNYGAPGAQVTIGGSNFATTTSANTVTFNGTAASILSASASQLLVQVPLNATSGKIAVTANGNTATSSDIFSVTQIGLSPSISSVTPTIANVGATITISGLNFYPIPGQTAVEVGGVDVLPTSVGDQQITFTVPAFVGSGILSVTTPYGTASTSQPLYVVGTVAPASVSTTAPITPDQTATTLNLAAGKYGEFVFQGNTGAYYSLQASAFSTTNTVSYSITSPLGVVISSGNLSSAAPTLHLPKLSATGTYSILLGSGSNAVQLSIAVEKNPDVAISGVAIPFSTSAPSQSKRFTFTATAGRAPGVRIQSLTTNPNTVSSVTINVYQSDGTLLTSSSCPVSSGGCGFNIGNLQSTGVYIVSIAPAGAATMSFTAALTPEVTNSVLTNGVATTISLPTPGQAGRLTFSGSSGQRISMLSSTNTLAGTGGSGYSLKLLNPDGTMLASTSGFGTNQFFGPYTLPQTGTYTLQIVPSSGGTGSITWQLYNVPPDTTGTIPADGTSTTATVGTPGQATSLTFSGTAAQRVSFKTTTNTLAGYGSSGYSLKLINPDGTVLVSTSGFGTNQFFGPYTLPQTGTYTLQIVPSIGSTGSITWQLYNVPPDTSNAITINGPSVVATSGAPGQSANLTFNGTSGHTLTMQLSGSTFASYYYVTILNPSGSTVLAQTLVSSGNKTYGAYTLTQTGNFKIVIAPYSGGVGSVTVSLTGS